MKCHCSNEDKGAHDEHSNNHRADLVIEEPHLQQSQTECEQSLAQPDTEPADTRQDIEDRCKAG